MRSHSAPDRTGGAPLSSPHGLRSQGDLDHAGTVAVKPTHRLTDEIREAIATVGIERLRATLEAERSPVERPPGDTRPGRPGKVTDLMIDARETWKIIKSVNDPTT
jgi:hypothetical protein